VVQVRGYLSNLWLFLVVQNDNVRMLQMGESDDTLSSALRSVPEIIDRIGGIIKKSGKDKKEKESSEESQSKV